MPASCTTAPPKKHSSRSTETVQQHSSCRNTAHDSEHRGLFSRPFQDACPCWCSGDMAVTPTEGRGAAGVPWMTLWSAVKPLPSAPRCKANMQIYLDVLMIDIPSSTELLRVTRKSLNVLAESGTPCTGTS
eukprot:1161666-Pelagomonas_calceolata.AAC.9